MINEKEWEAVQLSVTRKDFYQIWNELLDVAKKLSERWDPSSTNESDPGIVLLKVLTACADRINYDIDKNILEAFMPSAAQAESMRKLCNMMGYNIKYYHSAETPVTISYVGEELADIAEGSSYIITIPQYTSIKNSDDTINYITKKELVLTVSNDTKTAGQISKAVDCIEGTLQQCESANGNIVLISMLDDNNRYYLPETEIAENGIFIQNASIDSSVKGEDWTICDNLNTIVSGQRFYKLGFDSRKSLPYIQFPDDIGNLIRDGLIIRYIRTSGANGNVSAKTLSKIDTSSITTTYGDVTFDTNSFNAANVSASTNGCNVESINDAYNNFKKTIGTFDTLVACRDYMNKIYNLYDDTDQPYVSNIIVSDIRDDINNSYTLCSFNDYGICYKDTAVQTTKQVTGKDSGGVERTITISENKIGNFDLVLYPFKNIYINTKQSEYENSFKYTNENNTLIIDELKKYKTASHNFIEPEQNNDIICIKNYLKLNARITTTRRVNTLEEASILNNIYAEIYKNFNMRELDFGDEILYESILMCIKDADTRIKNVSLDEPILYTKYLREDNNEFDTAQSDPTGKKLYNKLALRNILAAKVPLFNYNTKFKTSYRDLAYNYGTTPYSPIYGSDSDNENAIYNIEPQFKIINPTIVSNLTLNDNEVISFRAPNFKSELTYPAYVNYYIGLSGTAAGHPAIPATFISMEEYVHNKDNAVVMRNRITDDMMTASVAGYSYNYKLENNIYVPINSTAIADAYYKMNVINSTFAKWESFITGISEYGINIDGIYKSNGANTQRPAGGYLIDASKVKYTRIYQSQPAGTETRLTYWIPQLHEAETTSYTKDGLGKDSTQVSIKKNSEYQLRGDDVFYINYTESSDDDSGAENVINKAYRGRDDNPVIIRPNFDLTNSDIVHSAGSSWTKTTGFDPSWGIPGMFTLGTNEQIEVRTQVKVTINESVANLYWILKDNSSKLRFYAADGVTEVETGGSYILQEGEYLFYTDVNKLDVVSYGSGTEIKRTGTKTFELLDENTTTIEDILEYGAEAIQWVKFNFDSQNQYIDICEYQYKNLLAKDTLCKVELSVPYSSLEDPNQITKEWKDLNTDNTTYKLYGSSSEESLPVIDVSNYGWQVRSGLNINCGPNYIQTLHSTTNTEDSITLKFNPNPEGASKRDDVILKPIIESEGSTTYAPLSLKMTQLVQSSYDSIDTRILKTGSEDEYINNFKIKLYEDKDVEINDNTLASKVIQLNNFSDVWTKISFKQFVNRINYANFNINVQDENNNYGLVMFYYKKTDGSAPSHDSAFITTDTAGSVEIFNYNNLSGCSASNKWWTNLYEDTTYVQSTIKPFDWDTNYANYWKNTGTAESPTWAQYEPIWSAGTYYENTGTAAAPVYEPLTTKPSDWNTNFTNYYKRIGTAEPYTYKNLVATDLTPTYDTGAVYKKVNNLYHFRDGINIVKFSKSCVISLFPNAECNDNIVMSDLDVVEIGTFKTENALGLNLSTINYYSTTTGTTAAQQLLIDIAGRDSDANFYYNSVLDNSNVIDINTYAVKESDRETLESPRIWYEYNNANNKFVISEIDASYLKTGIVIEKSSKM